MSAQRHCDPYVSVCERGTMHSLPGIINGHTCICLVWSWKILSISVARYPFCRFDSTLFIQSWRRHAEQPCICHCWSGEKVATWDCGYRQIWWPVWSGWCNEWVTMGDWYHHWTDWIQDYHWRSSWKWDVSGFLDVHHPAGFLQGQPPLERMGGAENWVMGWICPSHHLWGFFPLEYHQVQGPGYCHLLCGYLQDSTDEVCTRVVVVSDFLHG